MFSLKLFTAVFYIALIPAVKPTLPIKKETLVNIEQDITWRFIKAILKELSNNVIIFLSNKTEYTIKVAEATWQLNLTTVLLNGKDGVPSFKSMELESKYKLYFIVLSDDYSIQNFLVNSVTPEVDILYFVDEQHREQLNEMFRQEKYYQFFMALRKDNEYELYENCLYCDNGTTTTTKMNLWRYHRGFYKPLTFSHAFKGSFHGRTMKFAFKNYISGIFIETDSLGMETYGGMEYDMILAISKQLNYSIEMYQPSDGEWGRYDQINKRWTGPVGMVYRSEADVALGSISMSHSRYSAVSPTALTTMKEMGILSAKPHKDPRWQSIFEAFTPLLWMLTILVVIVGGISLYAIHRFSQSEKPISLLRALYICAVPLFGEPFNVSKPSLYSIFLLSAWLLMSTLIVSFYTGALTSLIMAPPYSQKPIDSSEDLLKSGRFWMTDKGSHHDSVFDVIKPELKKQFYPLKEKLCIFCGYEMILESPDKFTRIIDKDKSTTKALQFYLEPEDINPLYISKDTLEFDIGSWLVRKICPWSKQLTVQLVRIRDVGLQDYYKRKWFFNLKSKMFAFGKKYSRPRLNQLKLSHFLKMVLAPSLGYVLSLIVFVLEILVYKFRQAQSNAWIN